MTTPATMHAIIRDLWDRLEVANSNAAQSYKIEPNSYGSGFDSGYAQALRDTIAGITGEDA